MTNRKIDETTRDKLNEKLRPFGLSVSGGSYDTETQYWWINIETGGKATYNTHKVAALILRELSADNVVLDGLLYNKDSLKNWA